jgi:hypothetical protein
MARLNCIGFLLQGLVCIGDGGMVVDAPVEVQSWSMCEGASRSPRALHR